MKRRFTMQANTFKRALCAGAVIFAALSPFAAQAEDKKSFDIAWTIYAGWMPWKYADESGIMKKWADKYGIEVNITQVNDYAARSEEPRVGNECVRKCRSLWTPHHSKKKPHTSIPYPQHTP